MRMLLVIAVALVFSLLVVGVGVTLAGLAFLVDDWRSGSFWGWIGGAFGCVFGGLGSLAGTWNTYRQMEGAPDVVRTPQRTWLDRSMTMYGALGLALLAAAATVAANQQLPSLVYPLALFGGIVLFQAVVFGFVRAAWREPK